MTSFILFGFVVLIAILEGVVHISVNGINISKLQDEEPIKIIEGHDLSFECTSSYLNSSFIWTKDGRHSSFNQVKMVQNVQRMDGGTYTCMAISHDITTGSETEENRSISIEVLYPPSYPTFGPGITDGQLNAFEGEIIDLFCKSDANPEPNYQWRKGNKTGPLLSRNANYTVKVNSETVVFYCIVNNRMVPTVGDPITTSIIRKLQITVQTKAFIFQIEGGVYRTVQEGDSVNIRCTAYGRPPPKMWWTKENDNTFYQEGDILSQSFTTKNFSGNYYCNAENMVIASNQSRILTRATKKVHITVNSNITTEPKGKGDEINDGCLNNDGGKTEAEEDSKNIALFILAAIGWLGFACSMLVHIMICTKNRNKRREIARRAGSIAVTKSSEMLSPASSSSSFGIPGSYSDLTNYEQLKARSLSVTSSTNSESTLQSSVSSCNSFSPEGASYSNTQI